jgi:hypothetical protein
VYKYLQPDACTEGLQKGAGVLADAFLLRDRELSALFFGKIVNLGWGKVRVVVFGG